MKDCHNKLKKAFSRLKNLYDSIPLTSGCLENLEQCKAWCCALAAPSILPVEFMLAWQYVENKWTPKQISEISYVALKSYMFDNPVKPCAFWDKDTKKCKIHPFRCFACRIYGVMDAKQFDTKLKGMREKSDNVFKDQCSLISTKSTVSENSINKWWSEVTKIELSIGTKKKNIHENIGGVYRTYNEFILMYLLPEKMFSKLSHLKQHGSDTDILNAIMSIVLHIKKHD